LSTVFADTGYFVALISATDQHHHDAVEYAELVKSDRAMMLVTTDAVLVELLNYFARRGEPYRTAALEFVRLLLSSAGGRVEPQTRDLLNDAIGLYSLSAETRTGR
jgi:predicted nucleic acid-binding protein